MNEVHDIVATPPARLEPDQVSQHAPYYTETDNQRQVQFPVACHGPGCQQEKNRRYRQTKLPCKNGSKHHRIAMPGEMLEYFFQRVPSEEKAQVPGCPGAARLRSRALIQNQLRDPL